MHEIIIRFHWQEYQIYVLDEKTRKAPPIICQTKERLFWNLNELIKEPDEVKNPYDVVKTLGPGEQKGIEDRRLPSG